MDPKHKAWRVGGVDLKRTPKWTRNGGHDRPSLMHDMWNPAARFAPLAASRNASRVQLAGAFSDVRVGHRHQRTPRAPTHEEENYKHATFRMHRTAKQLCKGDITNRLRQHNSPAQRKPQAAHPPPARTPRLLVSFTRSRGTALDGLATEHNTRHPPLLESHATCTAVINARSMARSKACA